MTGELLLTLAALAVGCVGYVLGRIDGYWKRAEEERKHG